jgi:predicted amidohydrolase YtcJ
MTPSRCGFVGRGTGACGADDADACVSRSESSSRVLPEDILTCPKKHIEETAPSMTIVGERIVYRRP